MDEAGSRDKLKHIEKKVFTPNTWWYLGPALPTTPIQLGQPLPTDRTTDRQADRTTIETPVGLYNRLLTLYVRRDLKTISRRNKGQSSGAFSVVSLTV